jgi:ABC-type branched-subunit amino acid transport system ATPase component
MVEQNAPRALKMADRAYLLALGRIVGVQPWRGVELLTTDDQRVLELVSFARGRDDAAGRRCGT